MASRFPVTHPVQRCLNPVRVYRNGHYDYFSCGRCSACLLDKANAWSIRLANEIESHPYSIFFTLTYSNKYLPKLKFVDLGDGHTVYTSNNELNIRFNSVNDVFRSDDITIDSRRVDITVNGLNSNLFISYPCKSDIQLWLKLLRQSIYDFFNLKEKDETERKKYRIRYYIIAELGPLTRRCHYHGLLFAEVPEVAEYLLRLSMYQSWQMCDKALFDQYAHYCDSGASAYVTQYISCVDSLPKIYKNKEISPFRLASKAPSIGYYSFDRKSIYESLFRGINEYTKTVSRIETKYVFPYPSDFMHRLFPKCREYSLLSYQRLHYIYGFLWRNVVKRGFSYDVCNKFIRSKWFVADVNAAQACYKAWNTSVDYRISPDIYLFLLDMYYYKEGMFALAKFYEWQELHASDVVSIMFSYTNFQWYVVEQKNNPIYAYTLSLFLSGFGLNLDDLEPTKANLTTSFNEDKIFRREVDDILKDMVKIPKFNEKFYFIQHY